MQSAVYLFSTKRCGIIGTEQFKSLTRQVDRFSFKGQTTMRTRLSLVAAISVLGFVMFIVSSPPTTFANWQLGGMPILQKSPIVPQTACPFSPQTPVDWDSRLGNGANVLPLLDRVQLHSVSVAAGQIYWRVVKVKFENIDESQNDHSIYIRTLDENCNIIHQTAFAWWGIGSGSLPTQSEQPPGDICDCNYRLVMYGDSYGVKLLGLPSDWVDGMIMPMRRHVNYRITYQRTTQLALVPAEVPEVDTLLLMGSGLGGLVTWIAWQRRRIAR